MEPRIAYQKAAPEVYQAMLSLHATVTRSGLERRLIDLVFLRASQINGCAFCLDMHSKDLRAEGETEQRLYVLDAWREAPFYTDRERAALAWTEAVTRVDDGHVPDEAYRTAREQFTEAELAHLTLAIVAINGWNRLNIAFRTVPGVYRPAATRPSGAVSAA
jgi:AhpD family alkylhydroperoxidase